jgi:hypothetical protein
MSCEEIRRQRISSPHLVEQTPDDLSMAFHDELGMSEKHHRDRWTFSDSQQPQSSLEIAHHMSERDGVAIDQLLELRVFGSIWFEKTDEITEELSIPETVIFEFKWQTIGGQWVCRGSGRREAPSSFVLMNTEAKRVKPILDGLLLLRSDVREVMELLSDDVILLRGEGGRVPSWFTTDFILWDGT